MAVLHFGGKKKKKTWEKKKKSESVWPSGKALGQQAEEPRFESATALLSIQKLCSVDIVL